MGVLFRRQFGFTRTSGSVSSATLSSVVLTVGDVAIITVYWYNTMTDAITVADDAPGGGNVWTKVPGTFIQNSGSLSGGRPVGSQQFTAPIVNGGSSVTITANFPATAFFPGISGAEFQNVDTSSPVDQATSAQGSGVLTTGSITTTAADAAIYAAVYDDGATITNSGTGWTEMDQTFNVYMSEYQIATSTGTFTGTANSGPAPYVGGIVALKGTGSTPPPVSASGTVMSVMQ